MGLYSLEMAAELELDPKQYNVIAFEDADGNAFIVTRSLKVFRTLVLLQLCSHRFLFYLIFFFFMLLKVNVKNKIKNKKSPWKREKFVL